MKPNSLACLEPDYKAFIAPTLIRRMGRIIKMGVASAQLCLKDAGIEQPDAILTGTGLGCIEDTEKFLSAIIQNKEQFLTPTSFIQSTHNTVGGQIALLLKCNAYNFTYVHRGFSFESCVLDALMLLQEGKSKNILIGGVDETTAHSLKLLERLGHVKTKAILNTALLAEKTRGSIAGEGANFFILSKEKNHNTYGELLGVKMIYKPETIEDVELEISKLLSENGIKKEDVDLVVYGLNGDEKFDTPYYQLMKNSFSDSSAAYFKHVSGEFATANSFGFWLTSQHLKKQIVPPVIQYSNKGRGLKNILLYNHYRGINHAALLFRAC